MCLPAQVHVLSHFIMNGVCVRWKGRIDLNKLDGTGCLEFDEERAMVSAVHVLYAPSGNPIVNNDLHSTRNNIRVRVKSLRS